MLKFANKRGIFIEIGLKITQSSGQSGKFRDTEALSPYILGQTTTENGGTDGVSLHTAQSCGEGVEERFPALTEGRLDQTEKTLFVLYRYRGHMPGCHTHNG